jgi:hypothetical protein
MIAMDVMTGQLQHAMHTIVAATEEDMLDASHDATFAANFMEEFLRVASNGVDLNAATATLTQILILRATECTQMECVECSEDDREIAQGYYDNRRERFLFHLRRLAGGRPIDIAADSFPNLTGMGIASAIQGAAQTNIIRAWKQIQAAVHYFAGEPTMTIEQDYVIHYHQRNLVRLRERRHLIPNHLYVEARTQFLASLRDRRSYLRDPRPF